MRIREMNRIPSKESNPLQGVARWLSYESAITGFSFAPKTNDAIRFVPSKSACAPRKIKARAATRATNHRMSPMGDKTEKPALSK